ncbi:MAG: hypothetical protein AB7I59_01860 [Geminicoccaceae bacterium]
MRAAAEPNPLPFLAANQYAVRQDEQLEALGDDLLAHWQPDRSSVSVKRSTYCDTVMRLVAIRLLEWGMREKDICFICNVADYFLSKIVGERSDQGELEDGGNRRCRGSAPGVWSLCRNKKVRREAAKFVIDWIAADQPFTSQPDPIAFEATYRRYRNWGWKGHRRSPLGPSACLAIIRNIRSGELLLHYCMMCRRPSVQPLNPDSSGRGGTRCSFCDSAHKTPCQFTPNHRALKPA